jgi:serine O-acetyltransferase
MTNVPEGATVMGVPGRIIMRPPKAVQPAAVAVAVAERTDVE